VLWNQTFVVDIFIYSLQNVCPKQSPDPFKLRKILSLKLTIGLSDILLTLDELRDR